MNCKCPFCGGNPVSNFKSSRNGWRVECEHRHTPECPVNMRTHYFDTEEQAFEAWNTRT
jgi:hypothetical protein